MFEQEDYRYILKSELENRCRKNPRYSLRSFARDLGLSSARLSEILNRKAGLSGEKARVVAKSLGLNAEETDFFYNLVEAAHARSRIKRELAQARLLKYQKNPYQNLEVDHFRAVSDWYHLALLELMTIKGFRNDLKWIARSLDIQETEAKLAIERLERLELIQRKGRSWAPTDGFSTTSSAVPSEMIRKFHRQILQKALTAIDMQSMERRDLGAIVMSVKRADLPRMKAKIREFRRALNLEFGEAVDKDRVYCFSTQLFELTQMDRE
ncbi:MAG: TIGR02147 family protein [Bacteriovoracia bacterium]